MFVLFFSEIFSVLVLLCSVAAGAVAPVLLVRELLQLVSLILGVFSADFCLCGGFYSFALILIFMAPTVPVFWLEFRVGTTVGA